MRTMTRRLELALRGLGRTDRARIRAGLEQIIADGRQTKLDDVFAGIVQELVLDDALEDSAMADLATEIMIQRRSDIAAAFPDGVPPLPPPPYETLRIIEGDDTP